MQLCLPKPAKELKISPSLFLILRLVFLSVPPGYQLKLPNSQAKGSLRFSPARSRYLSTSQILRGSKWMRLSEAWEPKYMPHTLQNGTEGMCLIFILGRTLKSFEKLSNDRNPLQ